MLVLTFKRGKFVAIDDDLNSEHFFGDDVWTRIGELKAPVWYETTDFKAARRFKAYADERAAKILDRAFVKHYPLPASPFPSFLDPHQVDGITWVLTRSRSYLAHAPGAGKTAEAIVAAIMLKAEGSTVFIVPPSLTVNWSREVMKFCDLTWTRDDTIWPSIAVVPDTKRQEFTGWDADFLIVPDSMLTKPWVLDRLHGLDIKLLAVDEASRFKEPDAQRSIALYGGKLGKGRNKTVTPGLVGKARHAVLLDGSPMPNRPMELWAPTYAMSPESIDFMSQQDFGFRYCGAKIGEFGRWEFKHEKNQDELRCKLQASFMHVVPESALNHPERRRSLLFMSDDVRTAKMRSWERKHLSGFSFDDIDEDMSQGDIATYRKELGLRKVDWVADYVIERLREKDESILLFAWHLEVIAELEKRLRKYLPGVVTGETPKRERETIFECFQEGICKLIIGNILAMGRGNNLQRGDRAVFGEYSWCDETNKQAEKRISRRGNEKAFMRSDYIVCPNSMDEPILNAVFRKEARVRRIIG